MKIVRVVKDQPNKVVRLQFKVLLHDLFSFVINASTPAEKLVDFLTANLGVS